MRLLFLVLLIIAVWILVEILRRRIQRFRRDLENVVDRAAGKPPRRASGELVKCSSCGVHLPAERLVSGRSGLYCSEGCRRRGPAVRGAGPAGGSRSGAGR